MRSVVLVIALVLASCKPGAKGTPDAGAPSVGRLPVDVQSLPPEPRAGFTACHELADPPVTVEAGRARMERWRRERPAAPVHASDARVTFDAGKEGTTLPSAIRTALKSSREFDSIENDMLSALFPDNALVGWIPTSRGSPAFRLYALAERVGTAQGLLATAGRAAVSNVACAFEEGAFHRDQYRVEESTDPTRRLAFIVDSFHGDYGSRTWIDLRFVDLGATSAVLACVYENQAEVTDCDRVVRSVVKK